MLDIEPFNFKYNILWQQYYVGTYSYYSTSSQLIYCDCICINGPLGKFIFSWKHPDHVLDMFMTWSNVLKPNELNQMSGHFSFFGASHVSMRCCHPQSHTCASDVWSIFVTQKNIFEQNSRNNYSITLY